MKIIRSAIILLFIFLLISCSNTITAEEAEKIAIEKAESNGYPAPTLWVKFNTETRLVFHFSKDENKDVKVWEVSIDTENNPNVKNAPALIYYISEVNGEIIDFISGLE